MTSRSEKTAYREGTSDGRSQRSFTRGPVSVGGVIALEHADWVRRSALGGSYVYPGQVPPGRPHGGGNLFPSEISLLCARGRRCDRVCMLPAHAEAEHQRQRRGLRAVRRQPLRRSSRSRLARAARAPRASRATAGSQSAPTRGSGGCGPYLSCICPGGTATTDQATAESCASQEQTSGCSASITAFNNCEANSCGGPCHKTPTTDGG